MDTLTLFEQRRAKDELFKTHPQSPLPHHLRHDFEGLRYYDPNPDLLFTVPVGSADGSEVRVQTSDGQERIYRRTGRVTVEIAGKPVTLTLFSTGHPGYFLPFRDGTSGKTTYGAGRYLDIEPNPDGTVTIDFNLAYNPFCAYNDAYSCPLPPIENWLDVPVEAGEMEFPS
ncbi:MAG: DUF1684 domain-containing protein [Acidimicrobiia bacterium]